MRSKISFLLLCICSAAIFGLHARLGAQNQTRPRVVANRAAAPDQIAPEGPDFPNGAFPSAEIKAELVSYPNSKVAFICGPQLKANSRLNPFSWFDATQISQGHVQGREAPVIAPRNLTGAVNIRPNSRIVTGVGTRFRFEVDPNGPAPFYNGWLRIREGDNYREAKVASVQSDTQLTLTSVWRFGPINNAQADTFHHVSSSASWNYDHYLRATYYDTAVVEYVNYYRTGDPAFLAYARKMADALWSSQYIDFGTITEGRNHLPPRSQAFAGLILRALDDRPEYWDYLYREARATFDNWLKQRRNNSTLYYDIRGRHHGRDDGTRA